MGDLYLIVLCFSIASGVQTHLHPHPGRSFFAVGFPRTTYLPDCPLGRKVSFDRQRYLVFLLTVYSDFRFCVT